MEGLVAIVVIGFVLFVVLIIILRTVLRMYRIVGPNQALIVSGMRGTQILTGGGRVVLPLVQQAQELSLELMGFDIIPSQDFYTKQGVAARVEAVAQIKVKSDPLSIRTAAEQFLSKTMEERQDMIRLVLEGHLRGMIGQLTVEQIVKEPEALADKVRSTSAEDMSKMGLEVVSFTVREVRDENEYIANMGRPDIARIRRDADIAAAEAARDTAIRQAETMRESAIARADADQQRVIAETASQTRQAEAVRDLDLKKAEYDAAVKRASAAADAAYEIEQNRQQQQVQAELVRIERVKREEQIKVQEAEIQRRERELVATIQKPAEAEKSRVLAIAEAEKQRIMLEASGQADAVRARGLAEAEVIRAKGQAEAESMDVRASAFQRYNQAAILDKMIASLPELVKAMSEPLSKVDKITVVSTGNGSGTGLSQVTGDIAQMVAQVPALVEGLTGMKMSDALSNMPGITNRNDGSATETKG